MKFVLDTNIILKALIRDSAVRRIIAGPNHEFLIPEEAVEETRKHMQLIMQKSGLSRPEIDLVLETLLMNIHIIPPQDIVFKRKEAEEIMAPIDRNDAAFLAAAMSVPCDGIWSDDSHLKRQSKVRVWTTKDLVEL